MLLLPCKSLGTRERKRKRDPSTIDLEIFLNEPSGTEEKCISIPSSFRTSLAMCKEDWTEPNRGIKKQRLSNLRTTSLSEGQGVEAFCRYRGEQGETGNTRTKPKQKNLT